jgi:eukaryotic translation initiation factor 2C
MDRDDATTIECTVQKYFFDKYRYEMKLVLFVGACGFERACVLQISPFAVFASRPGAKAYILAVGSVSAGKATRVVIQPHKHFQVSGQRCMRKLTDTQTSTMIKATARTALDRETDINKLVAQADFAHDIYIDHYGVHVDSRMIELYGRVLDPPRLVYGGRQQVCASLYLCTCTHTHMHTAHDGHARTRRVGHAQ